jgi:hypothetical protein
MTRRTPGGRGSLAKHNFSYTQSWISFIRPHQNWTLQWVLQTKTILLASGLLWLQKTQYDSKWLSMCLINQLKSFKRHLRPFRFISVMEALCSFLMGSQTRNVTQHQKYSGTRQSTSINIVFCFLFVCLFVCLFWNAWLISTPYNCILLTLIQARVQ